MKMVLFMAFIMTHIWQACEAEYGDGSSECEKGQVLI